MDIDLFQNIENQLNKDKKLDEKSNSEEIELAKKLGAIEEYSIDRFEGEIAVLEKRKTKEMKKVHTNQLPNNMKEGNIIEEINGKYIYNEEKTQSELSRITEKNKKLWN